VTYPDPCPSRYKIAASLRSACLQGCSRSRGYVTRRQAGRYRPRPEPLPLMVPAQNPMKSPMQFQTGGFPTFSRRRSQLPPPSHLEAVGGRFLGGNFSPYFAGNFPSFFSKKARKHRRAPSAFLGGISQLFRLKKGEPPTGDFWNSRSFLGHPVSAPPIAPA
jgi:hypothetical protein